MKIFFDCEFTGLHKDADLISIGMITDQGEKLYIEITDYDQSKVTPWVQTNVIDKLPIATGITEPFIKPDFFRTRVDRATARSLVLSFLQNIQSFHGEDRLEFWSDCLAWDWVLLVDLIATYENGYPTLPNNVYYIPFDISSFFYLVEVDPDVSRQDFAMVDCPTLEHNALFDAFIISECYTKITYNTFAPDIYTLNILIQIFSPPTE